MEKDNKARILYLLKILYERTDEENPLSTSELIRILKDEYEICVYRTTLAEDIEKLREFGIDIITLKTVQNKYFIGSRLFDVPELKLLVDAVESSKLITEKKSGELVGKLSSLTSANRAQSLRQSLCTEGRVKPANEYVYYIVDSLNEAINSKRKVSFYYFQYTARKEKVLRNNGEAYIFSPYSLVWNGDYYYVIGYSDKHAKTVSFRVDRIYRSPEILSEPAVGPPEGFNEAEYINTMFRMFKKDPLAVELICDNSVIDSIIDKFGRDVETYSHSPSTFKVRVETAPSHVFYSWIFGFGGKVKICSPEQVKAEYAKMVREALENIK